MAGVVTSRGGVPLGSVRIAGTSTETGYSYTALSEPTGRYTLPGLPPGRYTVTLEASGFEPITVPDLILEVAQTVHRDFELGLLRDRQSIEVTANSGIIETESGQLARTVSTREIQSIPLNGRDYLALNLLTAGALPSPAGQNPHHLNGARADHVAYLLDGISNNQRRGSVQSVQPSLEVVQEFRTLLNSYAAEYGSAPGVVSVALKSGANDVHASIFEFLRNGAMDARGFFDPQTPPLRRNQFGAMLGAPIARNRTFLIGSYEGLRSRTRETRLAMVPTLDQRAGVFNVPIRDPLSGVVFGNSIPAERIDPVAANLVQRIPLPNRAGAFNFTSVSTVPQDWDVATLKLDHQLSASARLSFHAVGSRQNAEAPYRSSNLPGYGSTSDSRNQRWAIAHYQGLGASMFNEARFAFNRARFRETSINAGQNTATDAGISGAAPGSGLTNINIVEFSSFGDNPALPADWTDNNFNFSDTFSWSRSAHSVKAGLSFQRAQYFELFGAYTMGQLVFRNTGTGHPFANFLLGLPQSAQRQVGTNKAYLFSNMLGMFVQDDWRVHPNLTVNLGLRYDLAPPPVEKYNRWANFIPALGRSVTAGEPGFPRSLLRTDRSNFAPRVGIAWRIGRSARTVLRAGFGIFYGADMQFQTYQALGATAFPFTQLELLQTSAARPLRLANPFANPGAANPAALTPNGVDYTNPTPYTQNWNLTLAREFSPVALELSYVGSSSVHQSVALNVNQTIRSAAGNRSPFPGFSRIIQFRPAGNANYHALQITARRRLTTGLSFRSAFTWSKSIDNASFGSAARQPQNSADLRAERALSDFHRGRTLTLDLIYDLPVGRGVLRGWQASTILLAYDGRPFTPTQVGNLATGEPTRPDRVRDGNLPEPHAELWFDPTAFRRVPLDEFRFGNSGRNILIGPGALTLDVALSKQFRITERQSLLFRAEAFNVPNRANFGDPLATIDVPGAGAISSAAPGRQLQLGLKYLF